MELAVVIITHNNLSEKNGCIESTLLALSNQKKVNFEVVVIDNSSNYNDKCWLKSLSNNFEKFKFIYSETNNIAKGRNIGINETNSEVIVFMDDDTLLFQEDILYRVMEHSQNGEYGFAADRLWTLEGWYENNKEYLNGMILKNEFHKIMDIFEQPEPSVRNKLNCRHLVKTYIGNFGFIRRNIITKIGAWDERYLGYGVEDDAFAINLFLEFENPVILDNIKVLHIWHRIKSSNYKELEKNKQRLDELLKQRGIKVFHIGRLMYQEDNVIEYIKDTSMEG